MTLKEISSNSLAITLAILLSSVPQPIVAQTAAPSPQATANQNSPTTENTPPSDQPTSAQSAQPASARPDPSQAPLAPVPTTRPADNNNVPPDAPSEVQRSREAQETNTTEAQPIQQRPANPLGTATAQQGATRGGVASRPAGEAIAPAKQRQVHSLLIKVGLIAAGAAAVGTVVGLTRGTSSVPPGAAR
jgi:hypothetical protein